MTPGGASRSETALILTGGGIMGAAYEIGCLTALDQLFDDGFGCTDFSTYVGISAGSVIATLLAGGIRPATLFRVVANEEDNPFNWRRRDIYRFDLRSQARSLWRLIRNLTRILRYYRNRGWDLHRQDLSSILQEQFPAGLFSLDPLRDYLQRAFTAGGVPDRFDALARRLLIPAYDLDRGTRVVFGADGFREVSVCDAIAASSAIPFFFRPVEIGGRCYIDGSTGSIAHLDLAIAQGARLIVVINPRVPMNNDPERTCLPSLSFGTCSRIADLGISCAWEQTQRIENKVKLDMALAACRRDHPEIDIVLIEPSEDESMLFFQSPMSQVARHHVMTHGFHLTLGQVEAQLGTLDETFRRHGLHLQPERLRSAPPAAATT